MLQRWGLLDRLDATGCPPIRRLSQDLGDFPLIGTPVPVCGVVDAYGPRRRVLDTLLVEAAVERRAPSCESGSWWRRCSATATG